MSMITALGWVPRGHAAQFPTKYILDDDELGRISQLAKLQLEDAQEDLDEARANEGEEGEGSSSKKSGVARLQSNGYVTYLIVFKIHLTILK
jgi:periodic tryptophan protein 1